MALPKKSMKKKIIIVLAALVALVIIAVAALNSLLNSDALKAKIISVLSQHVKQSTGLDLVIEGPFSANILPSLGVSVTRLKLIPAAGIKPLIPLKDLNLAEASLEMSLWSLISGDPKVERVNLFNLLVTLPGDDDKKQSGYASKNNQFHCQCISVLHGLPLTKQN